MCRTSPALPRWRVEMMVALFLIVVCGLAALVYLISKRRSMPPLRPEQEREKNERYLRDIPPPPGW